MQKGTEEGGDSLTGKSVNMAEAGKMLRQLRGIRTRTGVARELSIPYSTLQAYEEGRRTPSGSMKQKLAEYYNVCVEDIFFETSNYMKK